jgi:sortase A
MDDNSTRPGWRWRIPSTRIALILAGLLLILAAAFVAGNLLEDRRAGARAQELLAQAEMEIRGGSASLPEPAVSGEEILPSGTDGGQNAASWEDYNVIGILSLPDLGLTLPVLGEYGEDLLKVAPCVFEGGWEGGPQGLVIAGHNYRTHFQSIHQLKPGATITFQTMDGPVYSLEVEKIVEIGADQPEKLEAEQWDMTLLTCNLDRSKRILVRCSGAESRA